MTILLRPIRAAQGDRQVDGPSSQQWTVTLNIATEVVRLFSGPKMMVGVTVSHQSDGLSPRPSILSEIALK